VKLDLLYELEAPKPWPEGQRKAEQHAYKEALEQIELADKVGFSTVWMVEHHFRVERSHCSAPEVFLGAASQRTKNIRMGHGVALVPKPFNHPIRLAERAAALDILSDGRVEFGTGRSTLFEQDGFRVDVKESVAMWREALDMIPKMWTEEKFSYKGKYWEMPERNVLPKPVQEPHPPLWTAVTSPERQVQAGEMGLGTLGLTLMQTVEQMAERARIYRDALKRAKPVGKFINDRYAVYTLVHCAETKQKAIENGAYNSVAWWYRHLAQATIEWEGALWSEEERAQRFPHMAKMARGEFKVEEFDNEDMVLIGDPDQLIRKMEHYEDLGVDHLLCYMQFGGLPHEHILKAIELLGKHAVPHFLEREKKRKALAAGVPKS
jgi:alkanesulfonate monooxygenase SsuD/methylene tetrahydromethanopterin reductase-like flavin-dependent oxidoreductase (luciferase family)